MSAYYNEIEPFAIEWLRELIKKGLIADGVVDGRDIRDVEPNEIREFKQCHFFAGIGVWSYALRLANWPIEKQVWTGSCPCQPFSAAGKRCGFTDERHLWPAWQWLIRECKPDVIFGEQVASKDGIAWLDIVSTDLEGENYAVAPVVLAACGVGAPHIRKRLWFAAERLEYAESNGRLQRRPESIGGSIIGGRGAMRLADSSGERHDGGGASKTGQGSLESKRPCDASRLESQGPTNGYWSDAEWIYCRDKRHRPTKPGIFPLAHGIAGRVGKLRGAGNAIVAQAASEIISAYLDSYVSG